MAREAKEIWLWYDTDNDPTNPGWVVTFYKNEGAEGLIRELAIDEHTQPSWKRREIGPRTAKRYILEAMEFCGITAENEVVNDAVAHRDYDR